MLPNQLNQVLQLSTSATASSENKDDKPHPLTENDKQFLSGAMESMCPDYVKVVKNAISKLDPVTDEGKCSSIEQKKAAFEDLMDHCDNLDIAQDFEKMGGFRILLHYISEMAWKNGKEDENYKLGITSLELLAVCCQLNEFCQQRAVDGGLLKKVKLILEEAISYVKTVPAEQGASSVMPLRTIFKCLSAISAICRSNEQTIAAFLNFEDGKLLDEHSTKNGLILLLDCLTITDIGFKFPEKCDQAEKALPRRIRTKAAFLIKSLVNREELAIVVSEKESPCDVALTMTVDIGIISKTLSIIAHANSDVEPSDYEQILRLLSWLFSSSAAARDSLQRGTPLVAKVRENLSKWRQIFSEDGDDDLVFACELILQKL